jgi:hypothetical protein
MKNDTATTDRPMDTFDGDLKLRKLFRMRRTGTWPTTGIFIFVSISRVLELASPLPAAEAV